MKIFLGAILTAGVFLLAPSIQKYVAKKLGLRRLVLSYFGLLSVVLLVFAVVPMPLWQWTLGILFMSISATIMWIVPRSEDVQWWMQEVFFGENDILDDNAPYARVVNLFKLPLMGLGLWVIAPWTMILLDIAAILGAFIWWAKRSREFNEG
jgi:hypothetical protein